MKKILALLLLAASPASAERYICLAEPSSLTLDRLRDNYNEVPILQMTMAGGLQTLLVASPEGKWMLLTRMPDGKECILGIGDGMKQASPAQRFVEEKTQ